MPLFWEPSNSLRKMKHNPWKRLVFHRHNKKATKNACALWCLHSYAFSVADVPKPKKRYNKRGRHMLQHIEWFVKWSTQAKHIPPPFPLCNFNSFGHCAKILLIQHISLIQLPERHSMLGTCVCAFWLLAGAGHSNMKNTPRWTCCDMMREKFENYPLQLLQTHFYTAQGACVMNIFDWFLPWGHGHMVFNDSPCFPEKKWS